MTIAADSGSPSSSAMKSWSPRRLGVKQPLLGSAARRCAATRPSIAGAGIAVVVDPCLVDAVRGRPFRRGAHQPLTGTATCARSGAPVELWVTAQGVGALRADRSAVSPLSRRFNRAQLPVGPVAGRLTAARAAFKRGTEEGTPAY